MCWLIILALIFPAYSCHQKVKSKAIKSLQTTSTNKPKKSLEWQGTSSAYQEQDLATNSIGMMRYATHVMQIEDDCNSARNLARRDYLYEMRNSIVEQHLACDVDNDCTYYDMGHTGFLSRIDRVVTTRECLESLARQLIRNCGGLDNPIDMKRFEPIPRSVACIQKRCVAKYEGTQSDWGERFSTYYQKHYSKTYKYPPQDELCKKLMDFPDRDFVDPDKVDYE